MLLQDCWKIDIWGNLIGNFNGKFTCHNSKLTGGQWVLPPVSPLNYLNSQVSKNHDLNYVAHKSRANFIRVHHKCCAIEGNFQTRYCCFLFITVGKLKPLFWAWRGWPCDTRGLPHGFSQEALLCCHPIRDPPVSSSACHGWGNAGPPSAVNTGQAAAPGWQLTNGAINHIAISRPAQSLF